jgi:hypothetical protein
MPNSNREIRNAYHRGYKAGRTNLVQELRKLIKELKEDG